MSVQEPRREARCSQARTRMTVEKNGRIIPPMHPGGEGGATPGPNTP